MMGWERILREQIYLMKRRSKRKRYRRPPIHLNFDKRSFGLLLILIGTLLLCVRCTKADEQEPLVKQEAIQMRYTEYL